MVPRSHPEVYVSTTAIGALLVFAVGLGTMLTLAAVVLGIAAFHARSDE